MLPIYFCKVANVGQVHFTDKRVGYFYLHEGQAYQNIKV